MNKVTTIGGQLGSNDKDARIPYSIEAEQQVIGALLCNNDIYERIAEIIDQKCFFDPVHARLFEIIATRIRRNQLVTPAILKPQLQEDEGLRELGGPAYLIRLQAAAISARMGPDYARQIYDLYLRRELIGLGEDVIKSAKQLEDDIAPQDQIVEAEQMLYHLSEQGRSETGFQSFLKTMNDTIDAALMADQRDGAMAGISTGLIDLDRKLGGLRDSDLVILAGRPSMGKTALATNIGFNIARNFKPAVDPQANTTAAEGGRVGFFSLEMSAKQLGARIVAEISEVRSDKVSRGDTERTELKRYVEAAKTLENSPFFIDDTPALSIGQLAARARRLKRAHGMDVMIVDYLQLIRPAKAKDSRVNEVSEITQGLKAIAKELDIPVIALSQLSRQVENREDKRPQLSDLRESGSIEQDADVVMFVYREEYYKEREKPAEHDLARMSDWLAAMEAAKGKAEVIISKQRHGPIGAVELSFEGQYTRFGNLVRPWQDDASA